MNLVGGRAGRRQLRFAGVDVPLAGAAAPRRARRGSAVDGTVIAGVRPADLLLAGPDVDPALPRLRATLEVVERLGSESHVIFPVEAPGADRRGGRRRGRGDRGGRRDAPRRRHPHALHGAGRGAAAAGAG